MRVKNPEITKILYEMATYLNMDDVPFKPQAYERAASAVESLSQDVEELYKAEGLKGLEKIPGVGKGIAERIEEYLKTRQVQDYEAYHKKYGSIFTIFKPVVHARFSQWLYPIFQNLFLNGIQKQYSREELEAMFLKSSVVHHACHSLIRYKDAVPRLLGYFPYFDELHTDLLGIKGCGSLLLKGGFTNRELEMLILLTICHSFFYYGALRKMPHLEQFTQGHAILLRFLLETKALRKSKKGFRLDFNRAFMAISQLASVIEYYMALGSQNEAREFLRKFPIQKTFGSFGKYIPKGAT